MAANGMTQREREELRRVVRQNFQVARQAVTALEAERLAEFEQQLATIYKPGDDPVWKELTAGVDVVVRDAQRKISARCDELGIPSECRPDIGAGWYGRGSSGSASRRAELRKVAQSRLKAQAEKAVLALKTREAKVLLQLAVGALTSDAARGFLAEIPEPADLMPALSLAEVKTKLIG